MMRLLRAELNRFWSRRLVWVVALVAMLATAGAMAISYANTSATGPDAAFVAAETERQQAECIEGTMGEDFLDEELPGLTEEERLEVVTNEWCNFEAYVEDRRFFAQTILFEDFNRVIEARPWSDVRPDTSKVETYFTDRSIDGTATGQEVRRVQAGLTGVVPGVAIFFLVVAVVIGASFMGAEYRFGTVENLLLWEPRRGRVLTAKYLAGFACAFALTVFLLSFLTVGLLGLASVHGVTDGLDSRFWIDLASTIARAGLVGGLFFVLAMAVSVIAKNTTAAVGVILGWFAVSNILIEVFLKGLRPWELFTNAIAFISEGNVGRYKEIPGQGYQELLFSHEYLAAGAIVAAWTLGFGALAGILFARRDVD